MNQCRLGRFGQKAQFFWCFGHHRRLAWNAAHDRDEAGAEAFRTGVILVAGRLVYFALAAEFRLQGQHGHTIGCRAAIAAAFADQMVDEQTPGRILHVTALAPAPLLGGAGLVVNQDRDPFDLTQFPLYPSQ